MRTKAIALVIILVGSVLPSAGARHLSVGYEDAPGMGVQETPEDPTVPSEAYERGLDEDCKEHGGNATAESLQKAATADAFCSKLVYHPNSTALRQESPPDQDIPSSEIGSFDVQIVNYAGTALEDWCQPFCPGMPWANLTWNAVHTIGQEADLTHGPEEAAQEENSDRDQIYYAALNLPNTGRVLQDQTGAWEMNGFYSMVPYQAFVGFLFDEQGMPVDEAELSTLIEQEGLGADAIPKVCGFSPEVDFAATAAIGSCEIALHYRAPSDSDDFKGDYSNECDSPTYVCGATAGGAWYGRIQCPTTCGPSSDTDYRTWHWVAAPALDRDCRAREPGFAFDPLKDAVGPYLAHDLDVYSPTASVVEEGRSVPTTWEWANDVADDATEPVDDVTETIDEQLGNLSVPDTSEATSVVEKDHRVEPNAKPAGELADTSQSLVDDPDLQRSLDDCELLQSDETEDTVDPWVDIVDGRAYLGANSQRSGTGQEAQVFFYDGRGIGSEANGLYLTEDQHQDASNRPGPATVWTQGKVGMFTDKDDDGAYDQAFWGEKYQTSTISEEGAYPMIWDMWVDDEGNIDENAGCTRTGGESITEMMADAQYGPNTGLAQLVYLNEPTTFVEPTTAQAVPYATGNTIFVLGSQSVHELWTPETGDEASELDIAIDDAIGKLSDYALSVSGEEPSVEAPAPLFGLDSAFQPQCEEPTGGFTSAVTFSHECSTDCQGDTIATVYTFDLTSSDGAVGGSGAATIPAFGTQQVDRYEFGTDQQVWIDVDPFDGEPGRNLEESSAPPESE